MTSTANSRDWRTYHNRNPRHQRIVELWVRDLIAYFRGQSWLNSDCAVLDFGCGYFDAGLALADRVGRIDGIDIEANALEVSRLRTSHLPSTNLFASNDELPLGTYDLIFANSVFQYLQSDEAITSTLMMFRTLLKPGSRGEVLLVDLIPQSYSSVRDASRSMWVAARHGVLGAMVRYLWKAAFRKHGLALHRIDADRMAELADAAGFDCTKLPVNLTPSRQRYSCLLKLR